MKQKKQNTIRLVVDDEQTLYARFSPEDEFSEPVKEYIRSKIADKDDRKSISLTVVSKKPLDEERFRSAASKWTSDEKSIFRKDEIKSLLYLAVLLVFGSILIVLSIVYDEQIVELKYSLMPIMGSLALSKAANILILQMPAIVGRRWILNEFEKESVITFEYGNE